MTEKKKTGFEALAKASMQTQEQLGDALDEFRHGREDDMCEACCTVLGEVVSYSVVGCFDLDADERVMRNRGVVTIERNPVLVERQKERLVLYAIRAKDEIGCFTQGSPRCDSQAGTCAGFESGIRSARHRRVIGAAA